jgi:hypothetical protein
MLAALCGVLCLTARAQDRDGARDTQNAPQSAAPQTGAREESTPRIRLGSPTVETKAGRQQLGDSQPVPEPTPADDSGAKTAAKKKKRRGEFVIAPIPTHSP